MRGGDWLNFAGLFICRKIPGTLVAGKRTEGLSTNERYSFPCAVSRENGPGENLLSQL